MGWDNEYLHYTNTDNPFGDNNLLDTFHWKKKLEKEGLEDISREEVERINRLKQEESKRELEKVRLEIARIFPSFLRVLHNLTRINDWLCDFR